MEEISAHNQEQINQEQNTCHVHGKKDKKIENIFHELGVNYTDTNEISCLLLLNEFNGDKILLEKYLLAVYKQLERLTNIKNLAAVFSKKLKEKDYVLINKIKNKKNEEVKKNQNEIKKNENEEKVIESTNKQDNFINAFLKIDKKIQENIVSLAEQNYLQENPALNIDMFKLVKKNSYMIYLRMLYFKLLKVIKIEYPQFSRGLGDGV